MARTSRWSRRGGFGLVATAALLLAAPAVPSGATTPAFTVGVVKTIPGHVDPTAVACPGAVAVTSSTCLALGSTNVASAVNRVVHGNPAAGGSVTTGVGVACLSQTTCLVVGSSSTSQGTLVWTTNGHVTKTVSLKNSSYLQGVTCGATTCLVVGELYGKPTMSGTPTYGVEASVTEAQTSPSATKVPGVAALYGAACETPTSCFAVGSTTGSSNGKAVVFPVTSGHLGGRLVSPGSDSLNHISCGSTTVCWMTGTSYSAKAGVTTSIVELSHGHPGGRRVGPEWGSAIGCVSATTCVFAGGTAQYGKGEVDELVNGKVVKSVPVAKFAYGALSGVACPSATTCLVTGATGFHNPGPSYFYTGGVATVTI
jgi:hypothetical protein